MAAVREAETQPQSQPQPESEAQSQSQTPSSLRAHPSFNIRRDRSKRKSPPHAATNSAVQQHKGPDAVAVWTQTETETEGWDSHRGVRQRRNSKDLVTRLSSTSASTPLPTTTSLLATNLMHESKLNADEYDMHMHIDMDAAVTVSRETTDIESCDNSDSGSVVEISKPIGTGIGTGTGTVVTATHGTSRREDSDVVDTSTSSSRCEHWLLSELGELSRLLITSPHSTIWNAFWQWHQQAFAFFRSLNTDVQRQWEKEACHYPLQTTSGPNVVALNLIRFTHGTASISHTAKHCLQCAELMQKTQTQLSVSCVRM